MTELNSKPSTLRLSIAGGIFIVGWLMPLLIPFVLASGLSVEIKTVLSGLLAFGIPEVFTIVTVCILGKDGFEYLKCICFKILRKTFTPKMYVSRRRYYIGLVFFIIPILTSWLLPYFMDIIPGYEQHHIGINVIFDSMFILSLFILGGDFWEKLRSLFIYTDSERQG